MVDSPDTFLETDAVNTLALVAELLPRVERESHLWKWVVIGLHNAIQAYMVLAVWGGDHRRITSERSLEHQRKRHDGDDSEAWQERYHLAPFPDLYEKIKEVEPSESSPRAKWLDPKASGPFVASEAVDASVAKLARLRDEFIHFRPQRVAHNLLYFPWMIRDCLGVISFLALDARALAWRGAEIEEETARLLERIRPEAERLAVLYASARR